MTRESMRKVWVRLLLVVAVVSLVAAAWRILPVGGWVERGLEPIRAAGAWGEVVYVLIYILGVVLMVPGSAITLAGGLLYGPWLGTVLVSAGSTIGAAAAFVLARTIGRNRVHSWVSNDPRFEALDDAISQRGAKVVLLLRLSPLFPFNVLNYALGVTGVGFWTYVIASWVGMLPGTVAYVLIGAWFGLKGRPGGLGPWGWALIAVGTLAATVYIGRLAQAALKLAAPPAEPPTIGANL